MVLTLRVPPAVCAGRIEKYIVRKAFDTPEDPYLPSEVLWRQKEQFSDGVGYSWIDGLKVRMPAAVLHLPSLFSLGLAACSTHDAA